MARGVNKVILIGNLGKDPELRRMPSGDQIATLAIATSETWKDRDSGQTQERTEWHNVVLFKRLAEIAGEYLRKGSQVYIEGSLRTRKWQDKNGQDRWTTEIIGSELQMLGGKGGGSTADMGGSYSSRGNDEPTASAAPQQRRSPPPAANAPAPAAQQPLPPRGSGYDDDGFDDDIPF